MNNSHGKPELVRCLAEHKWERGEARARETAAPVTFVESHGGYDHYIINNNSNLTRETKRHVAPEETGARAQARDVPQPARNRLFSFGSEGSPNGGETGRKGGQ